MVDDPDMPALRHASLATGGGAPASGQGAGPDPTPDGPDAEAAAGPTIRQASADAGHEATRLLGALAAGDKAAAQDLLPMVYEQLRALAAACFRGQPSGHTLQPTALVHEAFVRLVQRQGGAGDGRGHYNDRTHFLAVAATAMRQILTDHARRVRAAKRGGGRDRMNIDIEVAGGAGAPGRGSDGSFSQVDLLILDEALAELEALDDRKHRIVELRYFGGLSVEQVAEVIEVSTRTVESEWRAARAWLGARLRGPGEES